MAILQLLICLLVAVTHGLRYNAAYVDYNLNQNQQAIDPLDYSAERPNHTYFPSPTDWRFPFYTLFLDRLANGDPTNDDINGTVYERDTTSNQLRHGGDLQGLVDSLDYIQGMGMKGIYIAGTPFINLPWGVDSYSPVDLTLLDAHYGTIKEWQDMVEAVHQRGMYIILDHTMSTMGDLLSFEGFENSSATFTTKEHRVHYKSSRHYHDFHPSNAYQEKCQYPRFWKETGFPVDAEVYEQLEGCYDSDFDQYGDLEAFGAYPDWQRSLAKFSSVQDRLREWVPSVRDKIALFSCLTITMLDIDGFRFDKATQITVDALAEHNDAVRRCAKRLGKNNFFLPGEITGGNAYGSIFIGRGRQPDMLPGTTAEALKLTTAALNELGNLTIRPEGKGALDSGAFHYSAYRFLTRFLGLSGSLEVGNDLPNDWVDMWNQMLLTNDLVNPNTGLFDPRHMYGTMNQDVFRWPAISQGTERMLLGIFLLTLHMPGIPLVWYGEEQALYVLDSTADNYIFGRQAFTPSQAWMMHGCHAGTSTQYVGWPVDGARRGCHDPGVALDHRDPSAPVRNIMKSMYEMRDSYKTLRDGWRLQTLSKQTQTIVLEGSGKTGTEFGIFSVVRAMQQQQPTADQDGNATEPVWFVYHNKNDTTVYSFDCTDKTKVFIAPFNQGTVVKNLFYPYDEITLGASTTASLGFSGSASNKAGCILQISMKPFEFRAYVAAESWRGPSSPVITKFRPGHDAAIDSEEAQGSLDISLEFSDDMDCDSVVESISISSTVENGGGHTPVLGKVQCSGMSTSSPVADYTGSIPSKWLFAANLTNVGDGVHQITVNKPKSAAGRSTGAVDHFYLRVGKRNNPVVFPSAANYSASLVSQGGSDLFINHAAAGADKWRYSTNWASSWSNWVDYKGGRDNITRLPWSGTSRQAWEGDHVIVQYWSRKLGSNSFIQAGDSSSSSSTRPRRFPHLFAHGTFNKFGFDAGVENQLLPSEGGQWEMHLMDEWPTELQLNVWGINPDGQPDAGFVFGDVDDDGILDRMPPSSLARNVLNFSQPPPMPALAYRIVLDDATLRFTRVPQGNMWLQIVLFILLATLPIIGGLVSVWAFMGSFYKIKVNKVGFNKRRSLSPWRSLGDHLRNLHVSHEKLKLACKDDDPSSSSSSSTGVVGVVSPKRRKVMIATMEYNIDDWNIKIKIGGLGVMAQLMGKVLEHQDLIWVVPCVGGVDYPVDQGAESIFTPVMGKEYEIGVQYHVVKNITYVLLDAPVFRQRTQTDPYPPRMDDIDSAIYYSAWNYSIAEIIRRFDPDLYHINDYHGAAAPLYLLPERTIPCVISLHNAEFQGLWPMRNPKEAKEVCQVFSLDPDVVKKYVRFGSVFNLLHAGASYLRIHQRGFGAVGVSKKYGDRSYARYPIFWGLSTIGQLPNPDPSDTADWSRDQENSKDANIIVDTVAESGRRHLRRQAQEWAGLDINPDAELFVFVGRWSLQKGIDLIADIFPSILEKYPTTQLICVGPVIDLYGKFAALKLSKLMERYPGRVCSKPEFTSLPPYIFSGAEFSLIPSRDEPFGLVAIEFGRKGALGVGARVGGLGQMPGFWYTVESTTSRHLLHQFRGAIVSALDSDQNSRREMRARGAKQRFPVAQWVEDLDKLQSEAIRIHNRESRKHRRAASSSPSFSSLTFPPRLSLRGSKGSSFDDNSDAETVSSFRLGHRSRGSSISIRITGDSGSPERIPGAATNPSSHSRPCSSSPPSRLRTVSLPPVPDSETQVSMERPNPMFANQSATSSSSSLSTTVADESDRVDGLAVRIMSPNGPEVAPHALALPTTTSVRSPYLNRHRGISQLSVNDVLGDRRDFRLQKVDPFFADITSKYYHRFEQRLARLNAKNSETEFCIDEYLKKSEAQWAKDFRDAKLGRSRSPSLSQLHGNRQRPRRPTALSVSSVSSAGKSDFNGSERDDEFLLGRGYKPPAGLKKLLSLRVGHWPVYSLIFASGQILSANSYQIVLLASEASQSEKQLYIIAATYAVSSALWWFLFRRFQAVYSLSLPWIFYGLAFLLVGATPFLSTGARGVAQTTASALYATGASSGFLFFVMNFGDQGDVPTMTWIFRAAIIQGIQQLYFVGLWFWGSLMTAQAPTGLSNNGGLVLGKVPTVLVMAIPIAFCFWSLGVISFIGLPDYYRQSPDTIPSFYKSLLRRRVIPWFLLYVAVQNYFLTTNYGRSWSFLFASKALPGWSAFLLAAVFFVGVWAALLHALSRFSKAHPWVVPLFATGLGAPRWAQLLWGASGIGLYLPWAGTPVLSAILSRCLWLWLGVLDSVQGVGVGMVLLLTLTRQHVAATLVGAQVLGAGFTITARATAPHRVGPAEVFPDFSAGVMPGLGKPWFWACLILQLVMPIGFFKFFRKEQVSRP